MATGLNAQQRKQRARFAALAAHAKGRTNTGPARAASDARFRQQVIDHAASQGDVLTEAEITRRADFARREFYARMQFESSKKRQKKATKQRSSRRVSAA
jgi:hypothetical protein